MAKGNDMDRDDVNLEAYFEAGRAEAPAPSADLLARIMADADDEASAREIAKAPARAKRNVFAILAAAIGGWPALAGMATATAAGVWIGVMAPDQVATLSGGLLGATAQASYEFEDLVTGYSAYAGLLEVSE